MRLATVMHQGRPRADELAGQTLRVRCEVSGIGAFENRFVGEETPA